MHKHTRSRSTLDLWHPIVITYSLRRSRSRLGQESLFSFSSLLFYVHSCTKTHFSIGRNSKTIQETLRALKRVTFSTIFLSPSGQSS
eukprot:c4368_g1_i1 orf=573-833(+)